MKNLLKIFKRNSQPPRNLDEQFGWSLETPGDFKAFFPTLTDILPQNAVLCLEGHDFNQDILEKLEKYKAELPFKVRKDTIFPPSNQIILDASSACFNLLLKLTEAKHAKDICNHIKIIVGEELFLAWHDADFDNNILVSKMVSEQDINKLAKAAGLKYEQF